MVNRRRWAVPAVIVAAVVSAGWIVLRESAPAPERTAAADEPRAGSRREPDVPRIDLARLEHQRPPAAVGKRDLFDFGPAPRAVVEQSAPVATPPPVEAPPMPVVTAPTPPPLPALNVKYVGSFEGKRGLKVAVLMTDRKEILTGQAGEVVANRLKIVHIGLESVDVQEVGSEQVRRIPLKGGGN